MLPIRPNAVATADREVERTPVGGRSRRLATVARDFLLDPGQRLTEQERSLMAAMLLALVGTIADEIRVRLADGGSPALEAEAGVLAEELRTAGLLDQPSLIALLLRRADEVRIGELLGGGSPLTAWTSDETPAVSAAAMAVMLARAAARDRFGRPGLELGDCDAETAVHLAYAVGALLAARSPNTEEEIVAAVVDLLGRHDEGQRLQALEARLAIALEGADRLDGDLLAGLGAGGEVSLVAHGLARLAGIPGDAAWDMLTGMVPGELALLLRLAGQPRQIAARLLAALAVPLGRIDPLTEINRFDSLTDDEVGRARIRLSHPVHFMAALNAVGSGRG